MIFVDLGFAKKDLYLLFLGRNSHGHICGLNKAIHILFYLVIYIMFIRFLIVIGLSIK
jgi:hypothetical protein